MSSILGPLDDGPKWNVMSDTDVLERARDLPVGLGEMFAETLKDSFLTGPVGTAVVREGSTPDPVASRDVTVPDELTPRDPLAVPRLGGEGGPTRFQPPAGVFLESEPEYQQRRKDAGALSKEEWQASPSFRTKIPYDPGMTADRASALAAWHDASEARQAIINKGPGGIIGNTVWIGGMLAGSALDPVNYIPIFGPEVRAAQIAKFGRLGGSTLTSAGDAALNTAIMSGLTAGTRQSFGDDVSWQTFVTDVAIGAVIGGAFGAATSRWEGWQQSRAANEINAVVEARAALNDAMADVLHGRPVEITPTVADAVEKAAARVNPVEEIDAFRQAGQGPQRKPMTLTQFIARGGGLPLDDEAIARDFGKVRVPGAGALARKNGRSIDGYWREALMEAGYFPPDPDGFMSRDITKELFDALEAERLGQKVYSSNDADLVQPTARKVGEIEKAVEEQADLIAAAHEELGIRRQDMNTEALYDAANRLFKGEEKDPVWAYERALTAAEQKASAEPDARMADDDLGGFWDDPDWGSIPPRRMDAAAPRADAPDPTVTAAASSVGKRPASAAAEFGMDQKWSAPAQPAEPAAPAKQTVTVTRGDDGRINGAEISKPAQELADQFGIDTKSGDFPEMAEFEQLVAMGRVTPAEMADFAKASAIQEQTDAYARGLEAATICRVGA